jgi:hypothetical protein
MKHELGDLVYNPYRSEYGLGVIVEIKVALGAPIMYSIQYPDDVKKTAPWAVDDFRMKFLMEQANGRA